jgi:hypothetical protein
MDQWEQRSEEDGAGNLRISSTYLQKKYGCHYRVEMVELISGGYVAEEIGSEVKGYLSRRYTILVRPPRRNIPVSVAPLDSQSRRFARAVAMNRQYINNILHPTIEVTGTIKVADNRLYTPLNQMKKGYRAELVDGPRGERIVEIDTVAAHVTYFPAVLHNLGYGKSGIFNARKPIATAELDQWKGWCKKGVFHQEIASRAGTSVELSKRVYNKVVNSKGRLGWDIATAYDGTAYTTALGKQEATTYRTYRQLFPQMMKAAQKLRKEKSGQMHSELTRIEGRIGRDLLPKRAEREGIVFGDVHDGISCKESVVERLTTIFESCIESVLGFASPVKVKTPVVVQPVQSLSSVSLISCIINRLEQQKRARHRWKALLDDLYGSLDHSDDAFFDNWLLEIQQEQGERPFTTPPLAAKYF